MTDRFDLDAIEADDAWLDLLAAGGDSARGAGQHDPALALLADLRLAVEVEDELPVESIDDPESFLARCAALSRATDPFARKMAARGLALGVAAVAALSVSGVAAAVTGDPLAPYEKVIEKVVDGLRPETSFPKEQLDGMPVVDKTQIGKVAKDFRKKQEQAKAEDARDYQLTFDEALVDVEGMPKPPLARPVPPPQLEKPTSVEDAVKPPTVEPTQPPEQKAEEKPVDEPTDPTEPTEPPTTPPPTEPTEPPTTPPPATPTDQPTPEPSDPPTNGGSTDNGNTGSGTETGTPSAGESTGGQPTGNPTTVPEQNTGDGSQTRNTDTGNTGKTDTGSQDTGGTDTGGAETGSGEAGTAEAGTAEAGAGEAGAGETGSAEQTAPSGDASQPSDRASDQASDQSNDDEPGAGAVLPVIPVLPTPTGEPVELPSRVEAYFGKGAKSAAKHSNGKHSVSYAKAYTKAKYAKGKHSSGKYAEGKHAAIARAHGSVAPVTLRQIITVLNTPMNGR